MQFNAETLIPASGNGVYVGAEAAPTQVALARTTQENYNNALARVFAKAA